MFRNTIKVSGLINRSSQRLIQSVNRTVNHSAIKQSNTRSIHQFINQSNKHSNKQTFWTAAVGSGLSLAAILTISQLFSQTAEACGCDTYLGTPLSSQTMVNVAVDQSSNPYNYGTMTPELISQLRVIMKDQMSIKQSTLDQYINDTNSYHTGRAPSVIVYPSSTEMVSQLMKFCNEHRIPVTPIGSGTSLEGHVTCLHTGILIDMSRMNKIIQVHDEDMQATVEPGLQWNQLNVELKKQGINLFFPVDPAPSASIGGQCNTSASGTNAVRYGTMRQNVVNMTVVLADGTIIHTARRARKSSAGYNLTQMFVGSEGTLGVITEVTVKLSHIPAHQAVAVASFPTIKDAAKAAIQVERSGIQVGCIELLDNESMKLINSTCDESFEEKPSLFIKFAGSTESVVQDEIGRTSSIVKQHSGGQFVWAIDAEQREKLWEGRKVLLWSVKNTYPDNSLMTTDVCIPISRLADNIDAAKRDIEESGLFAPIVGHVGDGNFHALISVDTSSPEGLIKAKQLNERIVKRAIESDGTCTGEHGVGVGKQQYLPLELGETSVELMRTVKHALDPHNLMNPGKVFPFDARQQPHEH